MPDILIRGLCIPKEGFINLSVQSEGLTMLTATSTFNEKTGSYVWQKCDHVMYETIELPEHGDLIDRAPLVRTFNERADHEGWAYLDDEDLDDAPVIVPASEEATNDPKT